MNVIRFELTDRKLGRTPLRTENTAAGNKMFLQWCRDELVLSFIFVQRYRFVGQDAAS